MRSYPSKLLLFGEHVLLSGSTALAVPVPHFSGKWVENSNSFSPWQEKLLEFAASDALGRVDGLQQQKFLSDLQNGLTFESNIPVGYGLGSSGALCAGVYDRYVAAKETDLGRLKSTFAQMESFFHGASSGIDPLTSYLDRSLIIRKKTEVEPIRQQKWPHHPPIVFLLDTGIPRQTGPLVRWFMEQFGNEPFAGRLKKEYFPAHEALVEAWTKSVAGDFWPALHAVSSFQLAHFGPLIPESLRPIWTKALADRAVFFKICGAGGGGFLLGFAQDPEAAREYAAPYNIVFPF